MSDLSAFYGPNAGYVLELYDRYVEDASAVGDDWQQFFASFDPGMLEAAVMESRGAAPAQMAGADLQKVVAAVQLATGIREYGHLAVQTDPLGGPPPGAPEVEPETYGLTDDDLKSLPASVVGGAAAEGAATALDAIQRLCERYTTTLGFDYDHVQIAEERAWIHDAAETGRYDV